MSPAITSFSNKLSTGSDAQAHAVEELCSHFQLATPALKQFSADLSNEMTYGLNSNDANMAMLPSWIYKRPTGEETGEYLGLELNGTYVRIYLIQLHGNGRSTLRQKKYIIRENLKTGSVTSMIDFLVESVDTFLSFVGKYDLKEPMALGFVLSFPLEQTAINKATVLQWTKDFEIKGADGKDIAELLQMGLKRRHIPVVVEAVINGAAGCLLAQSYSTQDTLVACTISKGTNAAYWETTSNNDPSLINDETIINTEWGSFGDKNPDLLPRTFYDNRVNRQSVNPGVHLFEKMISGFYLGEISRVIMLDFIDRRLLFNGQSSTEMNRTYSFEASYMSTINADNTTELDETRHIIEAVMGMASVTLADLQIVKTICNIVAQRAARLVAAAMSAIINKNNAIDKSLTISMEGAVYEHFPHFPDRVNEALRSMYGDRMDQVKIIITHDGNGIGAGLAAMIACNQKKH
ncbi:hypothetical protein K501DRAFT_288679 [Backusella circina FSU 941]|nr:hypothetical protein K501DRAFT_288679 [Backusella circina FSU 941]